MNKALFVDIDGTLIRWVYFDYWVRICVEFGIFPKHILIELDHVLSQYKHREYSTPFNAYLEALLRAVKKPGVLKGVHQTAMDEVCQELARRHHVNVHVFVRELMNAASEHGYIIVFVSGSPTISLHCLKRYFPDVHHVLGTELPVDINGCFTGEIDDAVVHQKGRVIRDFANDCAIDLDRSIAIGDSPSDFSMFREVHYPIGLNPNTSLFEIAVGPDGGFPLVLEKKMIIPMKPTPSGKRYTTCSLQSILPREIARTLHQSMKTLQFM